MIGGHQLDRLASENADRPEAAARPQHLREADVVGTGGDRTAAARLPLRRLARRVMHHVRLAGDGVDGERVRVARPRRLGQVEARVGHAERLPDALLQERPEAFARHLLDDEAEDVGREAVLPRRARLEDQGGLGKLGQELVTAILHGRRHRRARIELPRSPGAAVLVGEAGGMAQQVLHRHLARLRLGLDRRRVGIARHLHAGESGQELRHGLAEQQAPLLVEHHDRCRGHRLRHRGDGEDGIGPHRLCLGCLAHADGLEVGEAATPGDADDGAGDQAGDDVALERLADAGEAGRIEADRHRLGTLERLCGAGGHGASSGMRGGARG